jgi:hypothetical protein
MKYEDMKSFLEAVRNKSFKGRIIVDSDCVLAYESGELAFDFENLSPRDALFFVLEALGANVDCA